MRLLIASDVHVEYHRDCGIAWAENLDRSGVDVLVIAGDLAEIRELPIILDLLCKLFPHVVYVSGNHEYTGTDFQAVDALLADLVEKLPNLHWLDDSAVEINGQRFVGGTLWYDWDEHARWYRKDMYDFQEIKNLEPEVYERNRKTVAFLESTVSRDDVVVTHHLPSHKSVPARFANAVLNAFFVHDMEPLIQRAQPKLWVHGHTHDSCDYMIGGPEGTRIVCNPFGIARKRENHKFSWRKVIDF